MPPMDREVRRGEKPDKEAREAARRQNAEVRAERVQTEHIPVPVPAADQQCPLCADGGRFIEVGVGFHEHGTPVFHEDSPHGSQLRVTGRSSLSVGSSDYFSACA